MKKRKVAPVKPVRSQGAELRKARLEELDRDQLSIFIYLTLRPERAVELMKKLNVSLTGYRPEGLGDIERSDLLADEFSGFPEHRKAILQELERGLSPLPEVGETLGPAAAVLGPLFAADYGTSKAAVRLLSDPAEDVRGVGLELLNVLADYYFGEPEPLPEGAEAPEEHGAPGRPPPDPTEGLRRELTRAQERADTAERERQARADQLQQARREAAEAKVVIGDLRRLLAAAEGERDRAKASLQEASSGPHSAAELRLRKEADELKARIERLEEERRVLRIEEARLKAALSRAASAERTAPEPAKAPAVQAEEADAEEAPPTWLMPVFTREFYDSLAGWDRPKQRLAFVKAMLLAQDHRHPSLRAIPLEGLPNLWRIRIASDVRLLYRRGEGNVIEILRLIDREDLDRWIKVEKLRS
ncbi:MAG: type II toxin-antitoxin system RelE family toxin [Myxococcales bacterium]